jgi:ABC-type transporter MlaC component
MKHPLKALKVAVSGHRTEGPMVPEISLANQRPAEYVFTKHVDKMLHEIKAETAKAKAEKESAKQAAMEKLPGPTMTAAE